jgi:hypothetical protein
MLLVDRYRFFNESFASIFIVDSTLRKELGLGEFSVIYIASYHVALQAYTV